MQNTSPNERHVRFETLVMPYMADVQRFVQAMTRETEQTKDIVSETLYRAYKNMDAVREAKAVKSWLFTIARHEFYAMAQKNRRTETLDDNAEALYEDNSPLPDAQVDVYLLHKALDELPEKQREALLLFDVFGFSLNEVQEMQKDSLSAVKQRLRRGREKLAQMLGADLALEYE